MCFIVLTLTVTYLINKNNTLHKLRNRHTYLDCALVALARSPASDARILIPVQTGFANSIAVFDKLFIACDLTLEILKKLRLLSSSPSPPAL